MENITLGLTAAGVCCLIAGDELRRARFAREAWPAAPSVVVDDERAIRLFALTLWMP